MKRPILISVVLLTVVLALGVLAAAQPPTPPPVYGSFPGATPNAADVIVIPPSFDDPLEELFNDPTIYMPRPTLDTRTGAIPDGSFLTPGTTAIVIAGPLNVRSAPNTGLTTVVVTQLDRGEDITVLGLSTDLQWVLIDTRGPAFTQGWVKAEFIQPFQADVDQFADSASGTTATTGYTLRARVTVNIRQSPVLFSDRVGILPEDSQANIVGVTNTYSWWKIEKDGLIGWVSGSYIYPEQPEAYYSVPILQDF